MILVHPIVKLFITHRGLHSVEEAVYNTKPVVEVPIFADQLSNMKIVERNGCGKFIKFRDLSEELFENAIKEVLLNPTYQENI